MTINRNNNFDLIRLIAAFQVLLWHGAEHLEVFDHLYGFLVILYQLPGVPIFFTISGFLISYSLERNNFELKKYFKNRSFRIFPALWVCTSITAILFLYFAKSFNLKDLGMWFLAQISFFQFYASPNLKTWGVGHPNGSLWSIAIELQFYLVLPLILYVVGKNKKLWLTNTILAIFFIISVIIKDFHLTNSWMLRHELYDKLLGNTVLVYLHFFLTGIAIYKNFKWIEPLIRGKVLIWLAIYIIYTLIFHGWLKLYYYPYDSSIAGIMANTLLSLLTISFAFSYTDLSKKLLHENDISYGIYIYHMPIVNAMLSLGFSGSIWNLIFLVMLTTVVAFASWKLIEQKILKLKM
ncbi:acyltransferase family protein [Emticicia sp. SJ17W-69]|uniref:acyltransferase family protein n=1 Tax=Emticicia sp. SJ17W-69 TaxID=3421657 RepID=UPI003EB9A954